MAGTTTGFGDALRRAASAGAAQPVLHFPLRSGSLRLALRWLLGIATACAALHVTLPALAESVVVWATSLIHRPTGMMLVGVGAFTLLKHGVTPIRSMTWRQWTAAQCCAAWDAAAAHLAQQCAARTDAGEPLILFSLWQPGTLAEWIATALAGLSHGMHVLWLPPEHTWDSWWRRLLLLRSLSPRPVCLVCPLWLRPVVALLRSAGLLQHVSAVVAPPALDLAARTARIIPAVPKSANAVSAPGIPAALCVLEHSAEGGARLAGMLPAASQSMARAVMAALTMAEASVGAVDEAGSGAQAQPGAREHGQPRQRRARGSQNKQRAAQRASEPAASDGTVVCADALAAFCLLESGSACVGVLRPGTGAAGAGPAAADLAGGIYRLAARRAVASLATWDAVVALCVARQARVESELCAVVASDAALPPAMRIHAHTWLLGQQAAAVGLHCMPVPNTTAPCLLCGPGVTGEAEFDAVARGGGVCLGVPAPGVTVCVTREPGLPRIVRPQYALRRLTGGKRCKPALVSAGDGTREADAAGAPAVAARGEVGELAVLRAVQARTSEAEGESESEEAAGAALTAAWERTGELGWMDGTGRVWSLGPLPTLLHVRIALLPAIQRQQQQQQQQQQGSSDPSAIPAHAAQELWLSAQAIEAAVLCRNPTLRHCAVVALSTGLVVADRGRDGGAPTLADTGDRLVLVAQPMPGVDWNDGKAAQVRRSVWDVLHDMSDAGPGGGATPAAPASTADTTATNLSDALSLGELGEDVALQLAGAHLRVSENFVLVVPWPSNTLWPALPYAPTVAHREALTERVTKMVQSL